MGKRDELAGTIVVIALIIAIVVVYLWLAWIAFNRFLFWFDLVFIPLSFVSLILSLIFLIKNGGFDSDEEVLIIGIVSLAILIFSLWTISGAYEGGYSDEAIKTKAELEKNLNDYLFILSIYTGDFRSNIRWMALEEFNKALCNAALDVPCDKVKESYEEYKELIGWKEPADKVAKLLWIR